MKKEKPAKDNKNQFTVTEVGTLLEEIRNEVKIVNEGQMAMRESFEKRFENLEIEVHGNSRRLDMVEVSLDVVNGRVERLEDAVSKLSKDLKDTRAELKADIHNLGDRLTTVETRS